MRMFGEFYGSWARREENKGVVRNGERGDGSWGELRMPHMLVGGVREADLVLPVAATTTALWQAASGLLLLGMAIADLHRRHVQELLLHRARTRCDE